MYASIQSRAVMLNGLKREDSRLLGRLTTSSAKISLGLLHCRSFQRKYSGFYLDPRSTQNVQSPSYSKVHDSSQSAGDSNSFLRGVQMGSVFVIEGGSQTVDDDFLG